MDEASMPSVVPLFTVPKGLLVVGLLSSVVWVPAR